VIIELPAVDPGQAAVGGRLRGVRTRRGLSVHRLAAETGLAPTRLGLAEQGRTRLTSAELHAVIGALRIPLTLLFADTDLSRLRPL
jgi:transcriptional regulator with XRE-family HTH domain